MKQSYLLLAIAISLTGCISEDSKSKELSEIKAAPEEVNPKTMSMNVSPNTDIPNEYNNALIESTQTFEITPAPPTLDSNNNEVYDNSLEIIPTPAIAKHPNEPKFSALALIPNYTPGCFTFGNNQYVELPATPGASYCIYYEISQNTRSQFFQLNQANQFVTDFNIVINHDINGDYNLSFLSQSNASQTLHTEPGHYYAFYTVPASTTTSPTVRVGVAVSPINVDAYEPNDSFLTGYNLSDELDWGTYTGTLDFSGDVDYFSYNAEHGQVIESTFTSPNNTHRLEVLNGSTWTNLNGFQDLTLNGPTILHFRVVPQTANIVIPDSLYSWKMGSKIDRLTKVKAWSDENLIDPIGMFRKFHNELKWEAKILDTTGHGISGARIEFEWGTSTIDLTSNFATTGDDGFARGTIATPDCQGDFKIDRKDIVTGDMWHMDYDPGIVRWRSVEKPLLRVGHTSTILNSYHMCNEDLTFTSTRQLSISNDCADDLANGNICSNSTYYYPNPLNESKHYFMHKNHSTTFPDFGGEN